MLDHTTGIRARRPRHRLGVLCHLVASGLAATLPAQGTLLQVNTNAEAALTAAIQAANALAFQTSAANPVVIEFANPLGGGQTISLTQALPVLVVDHVTLRVAGATPSTRVVLAATSAPTAFRIASRHAVVQNVGFRNVGVPGFQEDVFTAFGTEDLTLTNCDFDGATGNALWLIGSVATTVQGSGFHGSAGGLVATGGSTDVTIANCTFQTNQQAILLAVASDVRVSGCTFDGNGLAVTMQPVCADVTFGPGNDVFGTTTLPCLIAAGAVRLHVQGNQFHDNHHTAIQLLNLCADATIADNTLARNGAAIDVYQLVISNSVDVTVRGLSCVDGGAGVFADGSTRVVVAGSAPSPTTIRGNHREGVVVSNCSDVTLDQILVTDNLRTFASAQVAVLGGSRIDVTAVAVTNALGSGRIGLRVDGAADVRVGHGTSVLDHGAQGVLVANATDVTLGEWPGAAGSLTARGPAPLQILDCIRVRVAGTAAAPCAVVAGPAASNIALSVTNCTDGSYGPHLVVDGVQTANVAMQIAGSAGGVLEGVTLQGHTSRGLVAVGTPSLRVRYCVVDGGVGGGSASAEGILVNPGCHGAWLLGNLVRRQQGTAFSVVDSNDVWLGPGNRAIDNGGDGFVVKDNGTGAPARHATIQSAVAVGRGLSSQSGFRCIHMLANLTNVTATNHGTGVLLQVGASAMLVNTISWGNTVDRNRDPASSGAWWNGMRATSAGAGAPGSWSEQGMLLAVDPLFAAAALGDVSLLPGSPAIDSGLHATPVGAGLPCCDVLLLPRIRGGRIDRGAVEFAPAGPTGNSLELAGPWLRTVAESGLVFTVNGTPAQAGHVFLLAVSGSGTGPALAGAANLPLVPDAWSSLLLSIPAWCVGTIGPTGSGSVTVPLPPFVVPLLPELTFAAAIDVLAPPTNPVIVRFQL